MPQLVERKGLMNLEDFPSYMIDRDIKALGGEKVDLIKMCSNESPLGTNENIIRELKPYLSHLHLYPDPEPRKITETISKSLKIDKDHIIFGNGSTELLELIAEEFVTPGSTSILSQFTYPLYEILIKRMQGKPITVNMESWFYNLNNYLREISESTVAIFIANPNNPTGSWISIAMLEDFIKEIPERIKIIIDEAYYDYMEGHPHYDSAINLVSKFSNLIVTRTFSKVYGLAGLRIGYAVSHPSIINKLKLRKQSANVNTLAQQAAVTAYNDHLYKNKVLTEIEEGRKFLEANFEKMKIEFVSSKTNFILLNTNRYSLDVYKRFLTHKIIVQPMGYFKLDNFIRISISTQANNVQFISVLSKIMNEEDRNNV